MIRVVFKKKGFLKYISHLDLQRTMQRALTRAEIPLWYTEGFNPHPYICFASPLPLGVNSECEIFDIKPDPQKHMNPEEIKSRLNNALTDDLGISEVYETNTSLNDIAFAEYTFTIKNNLDKPFKEMLNKEFIPVIRKTKRSEEKINLKEEIFNLKFDGENIRLTLPAGNERAIKPLLIITAFQDLTGKTPEYSITRERFFKKDFSIFR